MPVEPGQELLHYRMVEKIGEGGMGVVWKAVDTTLDRTVAIKLLPESFALDAERLARFEREAKSLAALNHPHIAGIYGLHQVGADRFISMEYVEGEDLAQRLARGALSIEQSVDIARAVADALYTAHQSGVVHRDLKPGNVVLNPDGDPKVLDFGLAKAIVPDTMSSNNATDGPSFSPTVTSFGTVAGVILGTAAYMSPEQARARPVDKRADIWALGAVLFEMLTGKAVFEGETVSDTLASVLKTDPDWDALPAKTPPAVRRLLRRCLEKNPKQRLHDAADARIELEQAFEPETSAAAESTVGGWPSRGPIAGVATFALIAGLVLGFALRGGPATTAPAGRIVSSIRAPEGVTVNVRHLSLALSPDGEQLAFIGVDEQGRSHLYARRLDSPAARRIEGTEGAFTPFWSPDGRELGYHSNTRLMRVPAEGGSPRVVAEGVTGRDGSWSPDGTILFATRNDGPLMRVDADGGRPEPMEGTRGGPGQDALAPQFLPDGRHFIFQMEDLGGDRKGTYLGELSSSDVTLLDPGVFNGAYGDGHLLLVRDDMLFAQPLDLEARRLTGEPRRVAGPVMKLNYPFHGFFAVASSGKRLAYLRGSQAAGLAEVVWVDRAGAELERPGIHGDLYNPRLSHDGRRLALDVSTAETHGDIWVFDLARGSSRRLTRDPIDESRPMWTPDDSEILFFRMPDLFAVDVSRGSEARTVHRSPNQKTLTDISPDGRHALFDEHLGGQSDIRVLDLESGEARDWRATETTEQHARFSPDGRWLAYAAQESGRHEVYLDRFPERGERFRVSTDGGVWPVWRRDGAELYYISATHDLMSVAIDMDSDSNPIGKPVKLFSPRLRRNYFDVSPDGERFLLLERVDPEMSEITLVQNWTAAPHE